MRMRFHRRAWVLPTASLVTPIAVAAVMVPFRTSFAGTAAALVLVCAVAVFAVAGGRPSGYLATISSVLAFDFFLTVPYERLAINHRDDLEIAISLLVVGIVITELAEWGGRHRATAHDEAGFLERIYVLAELAASGAPVEKVASQACERLTDVLSLRACQFTMGVCSNDGAELRHDGTVSIGTLDWGADTMGLPSSGVTLQVVSKGKQVGRFALSPTPGLPVSLERRLVAVSIADQVGASVRS